MWQRLHCLYHWHLYEHAYKPSLYKHVKCILSKSVIYFWCCYLSCHKNKDLPAHMNDRKSVCLWFLLHFPLSLSNGVLQWVFIIISCEGATGKGKTFMVSWSWNFLSFNINVLVNCINFDALLNLSVSLIKSLYFSILRC